MRELNITLVNVRTYRKAGTTVMRWMALVASPTLQHQLWNPVQRLDLKNLEKPTRFKTCRSRLGVPTLKWPTRCRWLPSCWLLSCTLPSHWLLICRLLSHWLRVSAVILEVSACNPSAPDLITVVPGCWQNDSWTKWLHDSERVTFKSYLCAVFNTWCCNVRSFSLCHKCTWPHYCGK